MNNKTYQKKQDNSALEILALIAKSYEKEIPNLTESNLQQKIFSDILLQPNAIEVIAQRTGKSEIQVMNFIKYLLDSSQPD